jgi:hypothetical protein
MATGYGLDKTGRGSSPGRIKNFLPVVQTGSGAHPASFSMGNRGSFPGDKADYSPPTSAEVKITWILYIHSPIRLHDVVLNGNGTEKGGSSCSSLTSIREVTASNLGLDTVYPEWDCSWLFSVLLVKYRAHHHRLRELSFLACSVLKNETSLNIMSSFFI